MDVAALGWTVLIAVFAATVFGLVPGLRMASGNLQESLKDAGPGASASRKHEFTRSILVVLEVLLACILLVLAGLLLRSFMRVLDVDLGFQPERAAAIKLTYDDSVPGDKTGDLSAAKRGVIFQQILARVGSLPGVEAVGMVDYLPLGQNRAWGTPIPKGRNRSEFKKIAGPLVYVISPGYMRAMGTTLRGRDFTWDDGPKSEQVVLINEAMARFFWQDQNAVGQILGNGVNDKNDLKVVGVVADVHEENVDGEAGWQIYYPMTQAGPNGAELVIRTSLQPASLATSVLTTLREMNPQQPMAEFKPIRLLVNHAVSGRQFFMLLVVSFATLGLLLAALGIYGVISYSVTRQTQEIGIRMALGASAGIVQRQVLARTLRLALIGVVLGAALSIPFARAMSSLLFATSPWDAATYISMAIGLLAVAGISGYIPAFRASRINPTVALRAN
jgi:predicted permease